jgi:hypothetical protein
LHRRLKEAALALVSVALTIGPSRIGRLAALAAEGYLIRRRARDFRRIRGTLARFMS